MLFRSDEIGLPSVDDVNAQRVAKFGESITSNLGSDNLDLFRKLIEDYASENDVTMADIAAALALETRDGGFLLSPDPPASERKDRDRKERTERSGRGDGDFATYRLAVGRQNNVTPGAIVGAIANEGGLSRGDFGHISIRADHSLVELPRNLDRETLSRLRSTRIAGVPIGIKKDEGSPRGGRSQGYGNKSYGRDRRGTQKVAGRGRP